VAGTGAFFVDDAAVQVFENWARALCGAQPRKRPQEQYAATFDEIASDLKITKQAVEQVQRRALGKLLAYAHVKLGHPARDLIELEAAFVDGPDPQGVERAWRMHCECGRRRGPA